MDEKLLFIEHCSNTAVACGSDGLPEGFYEITGSTILKRTSREGEEEFSMKKCRNF
ncbi:MAG: hypothetical protein J6D08_13285 [Lachnospiraceae bacterium]|nr:hypothetical protein [Lachnospiraceae bacterium]